MKKQSYRKNAGEASEFENGKILAQMKRSESRPEFCVWLKVRSGTYAKGSAVVMAVPKGHTEHQIGDVVEYSGGTSKRRPLIKRRMRVRNQMEAIRQQMAAELQAAMVWNPAVS